MEVSGRKDSNLETNLLCQPCHGDGDSVQAEGYCATCYEYLCSVCLKVHPKLSATKNHDIKSKDEMPREHVQTGPCSELCAVHKTEIVKFYCRDHNEVGCGDCMVLGHKACKVDLVNDVSANYGSCEELQQIKRQTGRLEEEITSRKRDIDCNVKAAADINMKVVEEIRKFRKDINSYLDKAEDDLLTEAEKLLSNDVSLQNKLRDECESMQKEMREFQSTLKIHADKINQMFVTAKLALKRLNIWQKSTKSIVSRSDIQIYTFDPSKDFMSLKINNKLLGELSIKGIGLTERKKNIVDMKAVPAKKLNVQAANEQKCWITGIAQISSDEMLLADVKNKTLKILNVKENKITSRYSCQPAMEPWDVTVINAETAAATLPDEGHILFLNTKNGMSKSHCLKVRKGCFGLDHQNDIIAVSFCHPAAVQIMNLHGQILNEVGNASLFVYPFFIAWNTDKKNVLVSDNGSHKVYELTMSGQLKATINCGYGSRPRSLAVTSNGTVVVCCQGLDDRLTMIAPDTRETLPLTVELVNAPTTVFLIEEQNKLLICEYGRDSNTMKMFDLK